MQTTDAADSFTCFYYSLVPSGTCQMRIFQTDDPTTLDDEVTMVERSLKAVTGTENDLCTMTIDASVSPNTRTIDSGCTDVTFTVEEDFKSTTDAFDIIVELSQPETDSDSATTQMALLEKYMTTVPTEGTYVVVDSDGKETTNLKNVASVTLEKDATP